MDKIHINDDYQVKMMIVVVMMMIVVYDTKINVKLKGRSTSQ